LLGVFMLKRFFYFLTSNYYLELRNDNIIAVFFENSLFLNMVVIKKLSFLKFEILLDLFAVDYPLYKSRFQLNYLLFSMYYKVNLLIKLIGGETICVKSIKEVYFSADWAEREVWDLFGVFFSNSLSLRRILTDYGFIGHPLRRDFPLSGYFAVRWSSLNSKIFLEPVVLSQEYRFFDSHNPWLQK